VRAARVGTARMVRPGWFPGPACGQNLPASMLASVTRETW
jgi:hypothetical protein